jgi:hypothetical protein
MRDDWCVEGAAGSGEEVEAWNSPEFLQLSRRQQNVEIFKVLKSCDTVITKYCYLVNFIDMVSLRCKNGKRLTK